MTLDFDLDLDFDSITTTTTITTMRITYEDLLVPEGSKGVQSKNREIRTSNIQAT